jgi:hypothetical protein
MRTRVAGRIKLGGGLQNLSNFAPERCTIVLHMGVQGVFFVELRALVVAKLPHHWLGYAALAVAIKSNVTFWLPEQDGAARRVCTK